jgi:signal peptidase I
VGARWTKAAKPTFLRAFAGALFIFALAILTLVMAGWIQKPLKDDDQVLGLLISIGLFIWQASITCLIIKRAFVTTILRAALIWLLSLIPSLSVLAFMFLIVRPFVLEAFIVPTFSMAPTLVGWHKNATCPHCGQTLLIPSVAPVEMMTSGSGELNPLGICGHCFQASRSEDRFSDPVSADRIIVNKLLSPQRWDVIVFRFPRNPSVKYAMRLVGLPGEKVFVKDGSVWVNDVSLPPPESISNLQYHTELESGAMAFMGSPDQPWILKEDEFCVLGDFSDRASDSRFWGPVPRSNIEGVVTIRYWPIPRWHVWR